MPLKRYVPPTVSREDALLIFQTRRNRWIDFLRRLTHFSRRCDSKPLLVEMVWLPHYLVTFQARRGSNLGTLYTVVESYSSTFSILESEPTLTEAPLIENVLPVGSSPETAAKTARESLAIATLRNHEMKKVSIASLLQIALIYLPFWVCHYERRRDRRDFVAIDAQSGKIVPAKLKNAIMNGFIAAYKQKNNGTLTRRG
ncbi:MAG TPA: hypothetical protein PKY35_05615 [Candidatus Hydrogenedentes bacterium]|nr:hypothetical protein [Candidatus Hydrogenedentota bacterium]HOL76489.1 hypothetical protein [Candidatus Hydrogenedentota bacterium]HPO85154.1 hypothetical protein [Candidatus Hydrogenedentota bacterium]